MKLTYAYAIILTTIFLMGATCTGNGGETTVESPWFGGIIGISAEFEEMGTASDTGSDHDVWVDETFAVVAQITNEGEYTIDAHQIEMELKGISPNDFSGLDFRKDNTEVLDKVSDFLPDGDVEWVDFGDAQYNNLVGTHTDATIRLDFIYPYETYIKIPKVCFKEDIRDNTYCDVDSVKQAFASGGPISVGTVKESYMGKGKIFLEIPLKNVGNGRMKAYTNDEFKSNYDEFAFKVSNPDWDCTARGNPSIARITHPSGQPGNEEVVLRCTNDNIEAGALYNREVTVTLEYYYKDWIEQRIRIKDNPE